MLRITFPTSYLLRTINPEIRIWTSGIQDSTTGSSNITFTIPYFNIIEISNIKQSEEREDERTVFTVTIEGIRTPSTGTDSFPYTAEILLGGFAIFD